MDNFKNKVVNGFVWEGGTKLIVQVLSWIGTVWVARLLTPEDYGIVAVSGVFIGLMAIISDMGLTAGLINKKEINKKEISGIFWFSLMFAFALVLLLFSLSSTIEKVYQMPGLSKLIMVSSVVLVLSSLRSIPTALVMRKMDYKFAALIDMTGTFSQIVTTVMLAYLGYGAWSLIIGSIVMQLVVLIAYFPLLRQQFPLYFYIRWNDVANVIAYGGKIMSSRIVAYLSSSSPTFFSGLIVGQSETGQFSLANMIAKVPLDKLGSIFNRIIFPSISRIKGDKAYSKTVYFKLHRTLLTISIPILLGTSLVSEDLVLVLFTEKWDSITPLLQLMCLINILRVSGMIMPPLLEGLGMPEVVLRYNTISLFLIPIACFVGLQWGVKGMVIAWFFVYPLTYFYLIKKLAAILSFSLFEYIASFQSVLFASISMVTLLLFIQQLLSDWLPLIRLLTMGIIGAVVYLGVFALFFRHEVIEVKTALVGSRA
jgi:O-antigen/teichoic acid export membrane protein